MFFKLGYLECSKNQTDFPYYQISIVLAVVGLTEIFFGAET